MGLKKEEEINTVLKSEDDIFIYCNGRPKFQPCSNSNPNLLINAGACYLS